MKHYTVHQPNTVYISSPTPGLSSSSSSVSSNGTTSQDYHNTQRWHQGTGAGYNGTAGTSSSSTNPSVPPPYPYHSVVIRDDSSKPLDHNNTASVNDQPRTTTTVQPLNHHNLTEATSSSSHPSPQYTTTTMYVPVQYYSVHPSHSMGSSGNTNITTGTSTTSSNNNNHHALPLSMTEALGSNNSTMTTNVTNNQPPIYATSYYTYLTQGTVPNNGINSCNSQQSYNVYPSMVGSNQFMYNTPNSSNYTSTTTTIPYGYTTTVGNNYNNNNDNVRNELTGGQNAAVMVPFTVPTATSTMENSVENLSLPNDPSVSDHPSVPHSMVPKSTTTNTVHSEQYDPRVLSAPYSPMLISNTMNGWAIENSLPNNFSSSGYTSNYRYDNNKPFYASSSSRYNNSLPEYNYPQRNNPNHRIRYSAPLPPPPYQAHHTVRAAYQHRQKQQKLEELLSITSADSTKIIDKIDPASEIENLSDSTTPLSNKIGLNHTDSDTTIVDDKVSISNEILDTSSPISSPHSHSSSRLSLTIDIKLIEAGKDIRTTLMIRNVPNKYTQSMLVNELNDTGFNSMYDFVYLPIDVRNGANVGYGFINISDPKDVAKIVKVWWGRNWNQFNSKKRCDVTYARIQGRTALISRFQISPVVYHFPDTCQPLLFFSNGPDKGKPEPFPLLSRLPGKVTSSNDTSFDNIYGTTNQFDNLNDRIVMMSALGFGFDGGYRGSATSTANHSPVYRGNNSFAHRGNNIHNNSPFVSNRSQAQNTSAQDTPQTAESSVPSET